jgi:hypothetical protein
LYVDIYFILHASSDSYTNIICSLAQAAAVVQEDADNTGDETTRSRKKRKKRASTHLATKTVLDKYYNVLDLFYSLLECSVGGKNRYTHNFNDFLLVNVRNVKWTPTSGGQSAMQSLDNNKKIVTCFGRGYDEMVRMMKSTCSALLAKEANVRPVYICNSLDSSLEECLQNYKDSINEERSNSV